jgi:chromate reductase, NAD(P)H dehydrogenase (quinone)
LKLYGFAASTRENSLNRHLFNRVVEAIEARGGKVDVLDYSIVENLPLYTITREAESGIPDAVHTIAQNILAAEGLIIASPEYNFSIPGPLKNAIDWISRIKPSVFTGKPVLLAAASPSPVGGWRGLAALRVPLVCLGAQTLPWEITIGGAATPEQLDQTLSSEMVQQRVETALFSLL